MAVPLTCVVIGINVWHITATILCTCIGWFIWRCLFYPRFFSVLRHLPGPGGGHLVYGQSQLLANAPPTDPLLQWMDTIPNTGFIRYLSFFNTEFLLPTSAEALNEICNREAANFIKTRSVRAFMIKAMGQGIIFSEGVLHSRQRCTMQHAFSYSRLKSSYGTYWSKAIQLRELILDRCCSPRGGDWTSEAVIEIYGLYARVTLDLVCIGAFAHDFDTLRTPKHPLNHGASTYRNSTVKRKTTIVRFAMSECLPEWLTQRLPSIVYSGLRKTYEPVRNCFRAALSKRRLEIASGAVPGQDMLTVLVLNRGFSDEEIVDNMLGMYFAGTHSTAAALTWATYLLCKHADKQRRLREALEEMLSGNRITSKIDVKAVSCLPYLRAVVHETLRLYPPIPLTVRENIRATTIAGTYIPAGTKIALAPGAVNRCAAIWGSDAREFRPERWLTAAGKFNTTGGSKNGSNYDIMTFLHGPRNCIGQEMAKAEIAVVLAVMFSSFEASLADPDYVAVPKGSVIMRPAGGLPVKLKPLRAQQRGSESHHQ